MKIISLNNTNRNPVISSKQLVMYQAPLGKLDDTKNAKVKYKPTEKNVTLDELIAAVPKSK